MRRTTGCFIIGLLATATAVQGQDNPPTDTKMHHGDHMRHQDMWRQPASRWAKASDMMGMGVLSSTNQDIGKVNDLIVGMESGRILYMIVTCDGKECAVPTHALNLPVNGDKFQINCTKEELQARSYDKSSRPDFADRSWSTRVHSEFHERPYWESPRYDSNGKMVAGTAEVDTSTKHEDVNTSGQVVPQRNWFRYSTQYQKASDLIGKGVTNPQNEKLGKIEDLVIDPDAGRVIYPVLSFGGILGIGDKLFAIPWDAIHLSGDTKEFILDIPKERFKTVEGFDKKHWPNMADERWATELSKTYDRSPYWEYDRTDGKYHNQNGMNDNNTNRSNP